MTKNSPVLVEAAELASAFAHSPIGVAFMRLEVAEDPASFRTLYVNAKWSELLGQDMRPGVALLEAKTLPAHLRTGIWERCVEALRSQRTRAAAPLGDGDDPIQTNTFSLQAVPISSDVVMVLLEVPVPTKKTTPGAAGPLQGSSALLESAPDAVVITDAEGLIRSVNTRAERIFGFTGPEMLGRSMDLLIPGFLSGNGYATGPHITADVVARLGGQVLALQARRNDGSGFPVDVVLSPMEADHGALVSVTIRDTPVRKKTLDGHRHWVSIMQSSNDAIISKDRDGIITNWNCGAEGVFGYTAQEAIGQPITILIPEQKREEERTIRQSVLVEGGRVQHYETVRKRKDGSLVDVSLTISPIRNEHGDIIGASKFAHDITDRKKAEKEIHELNRTLEARVAERAEQLRLSEYRYHHALDSMMEGVSILGFDWRYIYVNEATTARTPYTREELIGQSLFDLYPGIEKMPHFDVLERCMTQRVAARVETAFRFPDGRTGQFALSIQPSIDGLFILSTDITDRKNAEAALRKSEERFHSALDVLIEGVQMIGHDWRYLYVNDSLVKQSKFTREELVGHTMMEKYPGIENSAMFKVLQECMRDRTARTMENEFTFPDGSIGAFYLSIQPVPEGLFVLSTDISQRKRVEAEVLAHREQLSLQNKELEQFAYIASHDLQEPLRMVTSYVQLLQRRYGEKLDSDAREFIAFAVDGTVRMKQLITDLLAYSRLGSPVLLERVDMNSVVRQVRANLATAIGECGAVLTCDHLPHLRASETEMVQVMQNLIGNAVKFRRHGTIPEIRVTGREERDHWLFEVQDNGIGIEPHFSDRVFLPFKRLHDKSTYSGSGIGLAVVQKIIHRYGGRIWFTSPPGEGTSFHFTIKRALV